MSPRQASLPNSAAYLDLLTAPAFRWSQTESDEETEELWLRVCSAILEDVPREALNCLRAADPPQHTFEATELPVELQALATDRLALLRVYQSYRGIGVTAGRDRAAIGAWAGDFDEEQTVSALRDVTRLVKERDPALEPELVSHAAGHAQRRVDSWLASISASEADVVVQRFGLRGPRRATLEEVGRTRGVSRERVRQIEARALRRLGSAAADELRAASRTRPRSDALESAVRSLSTSPGNDVHHLDDLLTIASRDETWWPCGIAILSDEIDGPAGRTEEDFARDWLARSSNAIVLDIGGHFMKRRAESMSPYLNAARKLLAIHQSVPITVVHEAVLDIWRSELWPECMLSVDWLRTLLDDSTLSVEGDRLVRTGSEASLDDLNQSERQLLGALQEFGALATLDELRERLPDLRQQGSTLSQTLYGRTPIVQRLGPSIFGVRGAAHDPERVAMLEERALRQGHPWVDRGGWKQDARRSLQYRIPSRQALPNRIRIPNDIADALLGDDERPGPLIWRTPDGLEHSVGIQVASAGTHLNGVRPVLEGLHASAGDTVEVTVHPDGVWAIALAGAAPTEAVVIRMGRGWASVAYS